ncbi:cytochrome P450 4c21-like [Topomyia yanbarensis]|uniref:cytochrome P450 4c21-like n=1 Tax=Topomyia yanbarensis TaxID=2498891 RepID=UPI00273CD8DE|nr:cytochrome P450 4c21-like [Topomyia yanbarensis]
MIEVLLLVVLIASVLQYVKIRRKISFAQDLPTVEPCYPIIGNGLLYLGQSSEKRFLKISKALSHPAKFFKMWLGFVPIICTNDPSMAQQILTHPDCLEKPYLYDFFKLDYGLFSARHDIWKGQRKTLNSTFNQKIINGFIPIFDTCAQDLIKRLMNHKTVQMTPFMLQCALEMVCATTIGGDLSRQKGAVILTELIDKVIHLVAKRVLSVSVHLECVYRLTQDYRAEQRAREEAYYYGNEILRDARARKATETIDSNDRDEFRKPQIFIDQLLDPQNGKKFEEIEIIHNLYTMITGGSDTTGNEMGYISLMLAMHPDLQEKVYGEIMTVFPGSGDPIFSHEALKQLQYTEMVIKETLRLFPIAPNIMRTPIKDVNLYGVLVPKGTILLISIFNAHRRKDVWGPNADKFDPENFSPERVEGRHPFAFLAFSGGTRNCIGIRYAMCNLKIILVHLLKNFKLRTNAHIEDLQFKYDAMLRLSTEPEISLERRATCTKNAEGCD